MSLTLETREKQKPIILIYCNNPLVPLLLEEYSKEFKIAYVGELEQTEKRKDFYRIPRANVQFVKNLEEKIDYAVIFLSKKEDKNLIPSFMEKISNDGTRTAVIINVENLEDFYDVLLEYKNISPLKFLFLGDVYSENPSFNIGHKLFKIIQQAISEKSIRISQDFEPIFAIYYRDAILGINQTLFGPKKTDKFYYLFYSEPQSINSLAYILHRVEPDLEIHYQESLPAGRQEKDNDKAKTHNELAKEIKGKIVIEPIYLDKYFIGFEKSLAPQHFGAGQANFSKESMPGKAHEEIRDKISKPPFNSLVLSAAIATLLFIVLNIAMIGLGLLQLNASARYFRDGDYKKASSYIKTASSLLSISLPVAKVGAKIAGNNFPQLEESVALLNIASDNFNSLEKASLGLDREVLDKTISDGTYFYFRFLELKNELNNATLNTLEREGLSNTIALSQMLPAILGYNQEKNYLILFQNNGELRPTGGFIGSIGELKLVGGKIESLTIQDVYEYDGKLKSHVEPHYIIRRYLAPHLYLRDSNFDPDFQASASTSALLYNLETGKGIDGVIAIDFEAVKRLIGKLGPIELASYKKTLDEKNTFDFLQTTIDDNFFPGSTQKRDVLTALFNQLLLKLEDRNSAILAANLLPQIMEEKHLLFSFSNSSIQSIFNTLGYGGTFSDKRAVEKNKVNDFLSINEANIGVNKANIGVSRSTNYEISFNKKITSRVSHEIKKNKVNDFLSINEANIGVNKANIGVSRSTNYEISFNKKITSRVSHEIKNN